MPGPGATMTPDDINELTARLAARPQDPDALAEAHGVGLADPAAYAALLERVAEASRTEALAAHWLTQAAIVCVETLHDPKRAARLLRSAVERAPKNEKASSLLELVYRENGKRKALATFLERRADSLAELSGVEPDLLARAVALYLTSAGIWRDAPLERIEHALDLFERAVELDPSSLDAIRGARSLQLAIGNVAEAVKLFEAERAISSSGPVKAALYRQESELRSNAGDGPGASAALRFARRLDGGDPALAEDLARSILGRVEQGEDVPVDERLEGAEIFATLATPLPDAEALPLWLSVLDLQPAHDVALEKAASLLEAQGQLASAVARWAACLREAPEGARASAIRGKLGPAYETLGRIVDAIDVTVPLAASGDAAAEARLLALYERGDRTDALVASLEQQVAKLPAPQKIAKLHEIARLCIAKGREPKALEKHLEVLAMDAANGVSLPWVEQHLRETNEDAELCKVLLRAARAPATPVAARKRCVREAAMLAEKVGDLDGAIRSWKQVGDLDRQDPEVRTELARLYERAEQWDDLVALLVTGPDGENGSESAIARLKRVAKIQEESEGDVLAAAATWRRIAALSSGDVEALRAAARLFERGDKPALAAEVLRTGVSSVAEPAARAQMHQDLGRLFEGVGELASAADAYISAADLDATAATLEAAERCFVAARRPRQAALAVARRAELELEPSAKAELLVREAELLSEAQDPAEALARLERATDLDPACEKAAALLERQYLAARRFDELVALLLRRAEREQREARIALRKRAADVAERLGHDSAAAGGILRQVLADGEDAEALGWLAREAEREGAVDEAFALLGRLGAVAVEPAERTRIALDEARLVADGLGDVEGAIARYERVLSDLDPTSRAALDALAALEEKRGNPHGVAAALERGLDLADGPERTRELSMRLADLWEGALDDPARALVHLERVAELAPSDPALRIRLAGLHERLRHFELAASLLGSVLAAERDPAASASAARRLAALQATELGEPASALATLLGPADAGDEACRAAYVELGDRLDRKEAVAVKLEEWSGAITVLSERTEALRGAFQRFLEIGRVADAARVVRILASAGSVDRALGMQLATAAIAAADPPSLAAAHELAVAGLQGPARAGELVRQAEELARAGSEPAAAVRHGEAGLAELPCADAEPLLVRLASLLAEPEPIVDLYERHADSAGSRSDRAVSLGRAAQVAAERGLHDRAVRALEAAIASAGDDATLAHLERAAIETDAHRGDCAMRGAFAGLLASSAGPGDVEPRRVALLRRAAVIAYRDLGDLERAFRWLGDALSARVEAALESHERAIDAQTEELRRVETRLRALTGLLEGRLGQASGPDVVAEAARSWPDVPTKRAARVVREALSEPGPLSRGAATPRTPRSRFERPSSTGLPAPRSAGRTAMPASEPVVGPGARRAPPPSPPAAKPDSRPRPSLETVRAERRPSAEPPFRTPPPGALPTPAGGLGSAAPAPLVSKAAASWPPESAAATSTRLSRDELIDDLFEAIPGLLLCEDAFLGAEFIVELALRELGCSIALVHLYDINRREFVVAAAGFSGTAWETPPDLHRLREAESDPLLAEAMRSDEAIVVPNASSDGRAIGRRWLRLERLPRTIVCFGVRLAGRYLGAIELVDPLDEGPFTESDAYAIAYLGEHFADFLAARGILVDRPASDRA